MKTKWICQIHQQKSGLYHDPQDRNIFLMSLFVYVLRVDGLVHLEKMVLRRTHQQKFTFSPYTSWGMWGIGGQNIKLALLYISSILHNSELIPGVPVLFFCHFFCCHAVSSRRSTSDLGRCTVHTSFASYPLIYPALPLTPGIVLSWISAPQLPTAQTDHSTVHSSFDSFSLDLSVLIFRSGIVP